MHKIATDSATVDNEFTNGNPGTGTPATVVDAAWLNTIQRELVAICEEAGLTLDPENDAQVLEAILILAAGGGAIEAVNVSINDTGDYFGELDNVEDALQFLGASLGRGLRGVMFETDDITLGPEHAGMLVVITAATEKTVYVPDGDSIGVLGIVHVMQGGAGAVVFALNGDPPSAQIRVGTSFDMAVMEQNAVATLLCIAEEDYLLGGALKEAT